MNKDYLVKANEPLFIRTCANLLPAPFLSEYWVSNIVLHHHIYGYALHQSQQASWIEGSDRNNASFMLPLQWKSREDRTWPGPNGRLYPLHDPNIFGQYNARYDRSLSDYIYSTHEQKKLEGGSFSHLRWLSRRNSHIRWSRLGSAAMARVEINTVLARWVAARRQDDFQDFREIQIFLQSHLVNELECIVAFDSNTPHLFMIVDTSRPPHLLVLFIKDDRSVPNLSHLTISKCAELFPEFEEINLCQDLGKSGLRSFKTKLRPAEIRHKWAANINTN
jgi:hypothetical protein